MLPFATLSEVEGHFNKTWASTSLSLTKEKNTLIWGKRKISVIRAIRGKK
ncbi:hypothetical protein [Flavobacterium sp. Root901]|nr:hypothetical protein [Flavobacterium sp. Root901]